MDKMGLNHFIGGGRRIKADVVVLVHKFLDEGRQEMAHEERQWAMLQFTVAKQRLAGVMSPSHRWYMSAPFAISSNRASMLEFALCWVPARLDTRFALLGAPDHIRSYQRLPRIARGYNSTFDFGPLMREVGSEKKRSIAEWRKLAKRGIALGSLAAIIHSRLGTLTPEKVEELEGVGIEDMYTPINVDASIMPMLPWLTAADIEQV
jgi:hypothetical protein